MGTVLIDPADIRRYTYSSDVTIELSSVQLVPSGSRLYDVRDMLPDV